MEKFVAQALSPATGLTVKINSDTQVATVAAPADQLSLAIGRDGQNAKLAGKLVGLHIDITGGPQEKGTSEKKEDSTKPDPSDTTPQP